MVDNLERSRDELLRLINERADESIRRILALTPEPARSQQGTKITTSTEGTSYPCPE